MFLALAVAITLGADPPGYDSVVSRARRGDVTGAVMDLVAWSPKEVDAAMAALRRDPGSTAGCLRSAVLLHTEAAFVEAHLNHQAAEERHLDWARSVLELLKRRGDGELEWSWELAVGYGHQEWNQAPRALESYGRVLRRSPDNADALLALGALREQLAAIPAQRAMGIRLSLPDFESTTEWQLGEALQYYDRALAIHPDLAEARLRRGRVQVLRGLLDVARSDLSWVLSHEATQEVRAHAELFMGDVEERQGRLEEAIAHYRTALGLDPVLQPAQIALSHALQSAGHEKEAAEGLLAWLRATRRHEVRSWYAYHTNVLHGYRQTMDQLWKGVIE
jgi:tetratricopeptide (TPR) repeat protein